MLIMNTESCTVRMCADRPRVWLLLLDLVAWKSFYMSKRVKYVSTKVRYKELPEFWCHSKEFCTYITTFWILFTVNNHQQILQPYVSWWFLLSVQMDRSCSEHSFKTIKTMGKIKLTTSRNNDGQGHITIRLKTEKYDCQEHLHFLLIMKT